MPGGDRLITCIWITDNDHVELSFYFIDPEGSWSASDGLDLGLGWNEQGSGWRNTEGGSVTFGEADGVIDISPLVAMSQAAVEALADALGRRSQ